MQFEAPIPTTTLEALPGKTTVRYVALVSGNSVRAKHIGKDIMAGLKQLVGGELKGYTEMMNEARQQAFERMVEAAKAQGANAIVGVRFVSGDIMGMAAEVMCFGTAVVV
jgi:uncharacterized protein YbjQ (UPF0145 family)